MLVCKDLTKICLLLHLLLCVLVILFYYTGRSSQNNLKFFSFIEVCPVYLQNVEASKNFPRLRVPATKCPNYKMPQNIAITK